MAMCVCVAMSLCLLICWAKAFVWQYMCSVLCVAVYLLAQQPVFVCLCVCLFLFVLFFFSCSVVFVIIVVVVVSAVCYCYYYYYSTIGGKVHIHATSSLSKIQYSLLPRVDQNTSKSRDEEVFGPEHISGCLLRCYYCYNYFINTTSPVLIFSINFLFSKVRCLFFHNSYKSLRKSHLTWFTEKKGVFVENCSPLKILKHFPNQHK